MASWVPVSDDSDFSLHNLPYGVFSTTDRDKRIGVAIGEQVLDLKSLVQERVLDGLGFDVKTLEQATINAYAGLGKDVHSKVRKNLQQLLSKDTHLGGTLRDNLKRRERCLVPLCEVTLHLPCVVGDYTDFFIGLHHAKNSADFLKPGSDITQLIPSWWEAPTAYHGRSSSVVVSGTPIHRPKGQIREDGKALSTTCSKLDYEVEFAAIIGQGSQFGTRINVDQAENHIFGFILLNDWSARDFQKNESVGPFSCKNFATSISPWIVPFEALHPSRVPPTEAGRPLPDYLNQKELRSAYDIPIKAVIEADSERYHVAECNTKFVIFSFAQMIAHHTRGGCPLRPGDILATGTMSGPTRSEEGCFLELSRYGKDAYEMTAEGKSKSKISRTFLEDGDIVEFSAQVRGSSGLGNVGFGVCRGEILPAN